MQDLIIKKFKSLDKVINFDNGKFEIILMTLMTIGKATYDPGW